MKKTLLVLLSALLILVGCSSSAPSHQVTTTSVIEKLDNKDSFILYIGSKDCSACQAFAPTYQEFADAYGEVAYSIEITSEMKSNKDDLQKLQDDYIDIIKETPTLIYIKDGKVVDRKVGAQKYSELENSVKRFELE